MSRRKGKPGKKTYMRLIRVERMLIDGFRHSEIVEILTQEFKIQSRAVERLIQDVKKQWADAAIDNPAAMKRKYIDRMDGLYRKAVDAGQLGTAVKIQEVINKLSGLYEREQAETVGPAIITISGRSLPSTPQLTAPSDSRDVTDVTETLIKNGTNG